MMADLYLIQLHGGCFDGYRQSVNYSFSLTLRIARKSLCDGAVFRGYWSFTVLPLGLGIGNRAGIHDHGPIEVPKLQPVGGNEFHVRPQRQIAKCS